MLSLVRPPGAFELTDPSGRPAGHVEVTLRWRCPYLSPGGAASTDEESTFTPKEEASRLQQERPGVEDGKTGGTLQEEEEEHGEHLHPSSSRELTASQVRRRTSPEITLVGRQNETTFPQRVLDQWFPNSPKLFLPKRQTILTRCFSHQGNLKAVEPPLRI